MSSFADLSCVLKVNVHCQACMMQMAKVLGSIIGVYSVDVDAEKGLARVCGEVDPNMIVKALADSGTHAEIHSFGIRHPMMSHPPSQYHRHRGYGRIGGHFSHNYYPGGNRRYSHYDNYCGCHEHSPSCPAAGHGRHQFYPMNRGASAGSYGPFNGGYCDPHYGGGDFQHNNCTIM